jgi:hypothetical protein
MNRKIILSKTDYSAIRGLADLRDARRRTEMQMIILKHKMSEGLQSLFSIEGLLALVVPQGSRVASILSNARRIYFIIRGVIERIRGRADSETAETTAAATSSDTSTPIETAATAAAASPTGEEDREC